MYHYDSFQVLSQDDIQEESLEFLTLLEPKMDIVVVGVGEREHVDSVRRRIFRMFSGCKIGLEVLPTVGMGSFKSSITYSVMSSFNGRTVIVYVPDFSI